MNISEYSQNHFFENSPLEFCDDKWGDYNKRKLSFTEIIEKLSPLVTEERLMTINTVIDKRSKGFIPILENIYDRGNASAAMRSAEAFGFFEMNRVEKKDQYFKSANRVTQGADKWLNIKTFETSTECIQNLKKRNYQVFATHLDAAKPISEIDFSKPSALIFGNEKDGVSEEALSQVDGTVIIPMQGFSQSFNISVAAALCFYHVYQHRTEKLGLNGDLNLEDKTMLLANYLMRSVKNPMACLFL